MHNQNFVIAVKHQGRVLREQADLVTLPFGAEYSIYCKNLNSTRAQFTVSVDGQDATEGCRLILSPNSSIELERFIKGGDLSRGNRFRFIERTAAVEKHRGVGAEDGLIRVECWKERVIPVLPPPVYTPVHHYYDVWHPNRPPYYPSPWGGRLGGRLGGNITGGLRTNSTRSSGIGGSSSGFRSFDSGSGGSDMLRSGSGSASSCNFSSQSVSSQNSQTMDWGVNKSATPVNDSGITVGGSLSTQSFTSMSGFPLEAQSVVLTLRLRGEVAGKPVVQPVTVDHKVHCRVCGQVSKSSAGFCSRCGASLIQY